ncbi:sortilin-related receptor-like [Macrobrachium rosenbergii]|uniref:sortilin-related receptor-like n=1 Tax=Macrobrachium rosenbergii TaxID=79674 RepID=UPI0034D4F850
MIIAAAYGNKGLLFGMRLLVWLFLTAEVHASPASTFARERAHGEISSHRIRPERKSQRLESGGCHGADVFVCVDGFTICHNQRCDSFKDCPYGDDEEACGCAKGKFLCDGGRCLLEERRCDGNQDCLDNFDEEECFTATTTTTTTLTTVAVDSIVHSTTQGKVSNTGCGRGSFLCDIDKCIVESRRCDGSQDCWDNSDEEDCFTATIQSTTLVKDKTSSLLMNIILGCIPGEFMCDGNRCVSDEKECNKDIDCLDNSDENNCTASSWVYTFSSSMTSIPACGLDEFRCDSLHCVPKDKICDGTDDCADKTDEVGCSTHRTAWPSSLLFSRSTLGCHPDEFECEIGHCIAKEKRCDGIDDCIDRSDELWCPTTSLILTTSLPSCHPSEFECDAGQCLLTEKRCDGIEDCDDKTDEIGCPTSPSLFTTTLSCGTDQWMCRDGSCIPREYRCDIRQDCSDSSDEEGCSNSCSHSQLMCRDGSCVPKKFRCDGRYDCPDFSDEEGCSRVCNTNEWKCWDETCIPRGKRCDGHPDCRDESDEDGCQITCEVGQWQCDGGQCIDEDLLCDGAIDCEDYSDEIKCRTECGPGKWQCHDLYCVDENLRCDGIPQCFDSSDEENCPGNMWKCWDGWWIKSHQRCDGFYHCYDGSDEFFCEFTFL